MRTIKARNGFVFTFPFEPPWEDLRAEGSTPNGGKFYIRPAPGLTRYLAYELKREDARAGTPLVEGTRR